MPSDLRSTLGYDAVGIPADQARRIKNHLPQIGCVFADSHRWWWIVPAGSHIDVNWPSTAAYSIGAYVPTPRRRFAHWPSGPRLIHRPRGPWPYTPPIPLYFLVCRMAGITPCQ